VGESRLSATEWAVLGVVAQGPQHGFAIAKRLASDGDVGRVWTVHRPRVYRALGILEDARLVGWGTAEPGASGPPRTPAEITGEGERLLDAWLREPVAHVRDVRSLFLLKLAILDGLRSDPVALARAQRDHLAPVAASLRDQAAAAPPGFDRTLLAFRLESARSVLRFLEDLARPAA
jgi:DNA-binding PadR family transcriptional regulator